MGRLRFEHRLRPELDRLTLARLHGRALRHAKWREPTGEETAAAVADLLELTTDPELLAETAGILCGAGSGTLNQRLYSCTAGFCIAAGADPEWTWYWAVIGHERATRGKKAPRQDWEPGRARRGLSLAAVDAEFAGLPMRPYSLTCKARGLKWTVSDVTSVQSRRTGRGEEVSDWRYELVLTGPLPGAPGQSGEFAAVMEWMGDGWGIRPGTGLCARCAKLCGAHPRLRSLQMLQAIRLASAPRSPPARGSMGLLAGIRGDIGHRALPPPAPRIGDGAHRMAG